MITYKKAKQHIDASLIKQHCESFADKARVSYYKNTDSKTPEMVIHVWIAI